jgi:hypothetical protein
MSNEEAKRKVKEILREIQAEESQKQASPVQPPKKLGSIQGLYKYLVEQGEIPPRNIEGEDKLKPRHLYSDADRASQDMVVQLNKDYYEQAKAEAEKRGMSLSSYVRESLLHRLKKVSPEKELEIDQLLGECTSLEVEQIKFILEGERGFLNQIAKRGLTGEVWTPSQIDKVVLRISRSPRSIEEQCIQAMKLDKMQIQYFKTQIEYVRNTQPEQKIWFVPFGICDRCHRPLTKDQFQTLSNCPYCKETKGTEFVYDKEAPAQSKPYAMCAECHRPLPKEAKTWKECKYCGTTEQETVLNYEGIQRQTPSSTQTPDKEQTEEILETVAQSERSEKEETEEES